MGQVPTDSITDVISTLTKVSRDLIMSGLNVHSYNKIVLSEALTFYEVLAELESRSNISSWTIAPPAVVYAAFVTKDCTFLSRVCALMSRYFTMALIPRIQNLQDFDTKRNILCIYIEDIVGALWYNKVFKIYKK